MSRKTVKDITQKHLSPFEHIKRTNDAGNEYWSSRDFAQVLDYSDYRNFEQVINKARTSCFNSGQRIDDHFVDVTDMVKIKSCNAGSRINVLLTSTKHQNKFDGS